MPIMSSAIHETHCQYTRSIRRYAIYRAQLPALAPGTNEIIDRLAALASMVRTNYLASSLDRWTILGTQYRIFQLDDSLHGLAEGREGFISPLDIRRPANTPVMTTASIPFAVLVEENVQNEEGIEQLLTLGDTLYAVGRRALRMHALEQVS